MLIYGNQELPVEKDQFTIGRAKTSDLPIRDPNVSRNHAIIERVGETFIMVDLGSTNGVEFNDERIDRKPIEHGDSFVVGGHRIDFRYDP